MFIGDKVRELREAKEPRMSQEQLAWLAETTTRTISRVELNQVIPHRATLRRIAVALGESPDFFMIYVAIRPKWEIGKRVRSRVTA